jgi:DNA-binding SARP family transcriptional activator
MARLEVHLLGGFQATRGGRDVTSFESDKARALLAYLSIEASRPHRRESLAVLLWPDRSKVTAHHCLRQTLYRVRRVLSEEESASLLVATPHDIQFKATPDYWLDVAEFSALLSACREHHHGRLVCCDLCRPRLRQAVELYRGDFLAGFSLSDSEDFEEWALLKQEGLHLLALEALQALVRDAEQRGEYDRAAYYAWRQIELEPWREESHRQRMRVLALSGERSEALHQYEQCQRILADELGVEPSAETTSLYEAIRDGTLERPADETRRSAEPEVGYQKAAAYRAGPACGPSNGRPLFVARERELALLDARLEAAIAGRRQIVFIAGESGSGKTSLLNEFSNRAVQSRDDVIVLSARCRGRDAISDPFRPFLDMIELLSGDIEARRAGDAVTAEEARRLWDFTPEAIQTLIKISPGLIGRFAPGRSILARARAAAVGPLSWLDDLETLTQPKPAVTVAITVEQSRLFAEFTDLLRALSRKRPLIVLLDDLQWADNGSINLLGHVGTALPGQSILIVAAYRPEEIGAGPDGEPHPLGSVVNDLLARQGDYQLNLAEADGKSFVEALVDSEPNRLGKQFRERLYQRTKGHALFTVELLRGLQESGGLWRDEEDRWIQGPHLDWQMLPTRVEAAIADRISRLPTLLAATLRLASVEGDEFTAEVLARVQGVEATDLYRRLSGPLTKEHHLVVASDVLRVAGHRLSRYRFRHHLFQQYLYSRLDEVEKAHRHDAVGRALEELYGEQAPRVARELARHFEFAGMVEKTVEYRLQAGNQAMELLAHREAVEDFHHALAFLATLPESPERDRQELRLQFGLGSSLLATEGIGSRARIEAYARAYELSRRLGERVQLWPALHALASSSTSRGEYLQAVELGEQLLDLAERSAEPAVVALAHFTLGSTLFSAGTSLVGSRDHLEQAILYYERDSDPDSRQLLTSLNVFDVGVNSRAWLADVLWLLGYPDQALQRSREGLALAQQSDHFLTKVIGLYSAGHVHQFRREDSGTSEAVRALERLVGGKNLLIGDVWVDVFSGWLQVRTGQVDEGLARILRGATAWQRTGAVFGTSSQLIVLADASLLACQVQEGLDAVSKALDFVERTGARPNGAELHRLRGELLLARGGDQDLTAVEECFYRALDIARWQEAKGWELRAATSLARLWQRQGRRKEAREMLQAIYGWFTEGFGTSDLKEAKALIDRLASG